MLLKVQCIYSVRWGKFVMSWKNNKIKFAA